MLGKCKFLISTKVIGSNRYSSMQYKYKKKKKSQDHLSMFIIITMILVMILIEKACLYHEIFLLNILHESLPLVNEKHKLFDEKFKKRNENK